jgi:hypothetical protein
MTEDPSFAPEPYTTLYQRALYQSLRTLTAQVFALFRGRMDSLPSTASILCRGGGGAKNNKSLKSSKMLLHRKIEASRTRVHGDYHLGQVLYTGKDFVIIDFEGEPARSLGERRLKRSPLRDVAGMLRSFDYAAHNALRLEQASGLIRAEDVEALEHWADFWADWVSAAFLKSYLETAQTGSFLPPSPEDFSLLLRILILEKAIYELAYELNNRPDWVQIPMRGIRQLLKYRLGGGEQVTEPHDKVEYQYSLIHDDDLHLFNEGTHLRLYARLGAHPASFGGQSGTCFAVWAPNATEVNVMGSFNGWSKEAHPLRARGGSGIWEGFIPE